MPSRLHQIVYISRAVRHLDFEDVEALHESSIIMNGVSGVTGLLLFDGARFIQAIEGRGEEVRSTMARIMRDRRHESIQLIADHATNAREFGDWAMDWRRPKAASPGASYVEQVKRKIVQVTKPELKAAFLGFACLSRDNTAVLRGRALGRNRDQRHLRGSML